MKIQYCSDLHLEFSENLQYLKEFPLQPTGEILILAGDIVPFEQIDKYQRFFNKLAKDYEMVYWLPGNHEYYNYDVSSKSGSFIEKIKKNVWLVNNTTINRGDTSFLFSTLWANISLENEWFVQRGMTDFRAISNNGKRFTTENFNALHRESRSFLEANSSIEGKKVVVTHHIPTFLNYPVQYKDDILNEAFAVELSDLIHAMEPQAWIFGHHHKNIPEFHIGNTRMLTNQLGYVKFGEHGRFRNNAVLEI